MTPEQELASRMIVALDDAVKGYVERNRRTPFGEVQNRQYQHALQYHSPAPENYAEITRSGSAGWRLFTLFGMNTGDADCWIQLFDRPSLDVLNTGDVPVISQYAYAGTNFSFDIRHIPWFFRSGIVAVASSTAFTKTMLTTSKILFFSQFLHEGA